MEQEQTLYDRGREQAESGTFVAFIPSVEGFSLKLYHATVEEPSWQHYSRITEERVWTMVHHIERIRRLEDYPVPHPMDYR